MSALSMISPETLDEARLRLQSIYHQQAKVEMLLEWMSEARARDISLALDLCTLAIPLLINIGDEIAKARIYLEIGICRCEGGKWEQGFKDLKVAYRSFHECGDIANAVRASRELGMQAGRWGSPGDALLWLRRWYDRAKDGEDTGSLADALEQLGEFHARQGEHDLALEYYLKGLVQREIIGDRGKTGRTLAAIGVIYERTDDYRAAADFLQRAQEIFKEVGDTAGEVEVLGHLAHVRFLRGDLDGAMDNWQTALVIYRAIDSRQGIGKTLAGLGNVYEKKGDKEMAFYQQREALKSLENTDAYQCQIAALRNLGRLNIHHDQYDAWFMLRQALLLAEKIGDLKLQYELHYELFTVMEKRGDCRNALNHHKRYADIRLMLAGEETRKRMAFNKVLFDVERAEREREREQKRAKNLENEVRRKEKELAEATLNLTRMAELVRKAKKEARRIEKKPGRNTTTVITTALNELEQEIGAETRWNMREEQFGDDQREFMQRLRELTEPLTRSLTATEERICYLLRLDLQTKDAARLLCVDPRTVETHRLNIRRKLKPLLGGSNMRLNTFLKGLR